MHSLPQHSKNVPFPHLLIHITAMVPPSRCHRDGCHHCDGVNVTGSVGTVYHNIEKIIFVVLNCVNWTEFNMHSLPQHSKNLPFPHLLIYTTVMVPPWRLSAQSTIINIEKIIFVVQNCVNWTEFNMHSLPQHSKNVPFPHLRICTTVMVPKWALLFLC